MEQVSEQLPQKERIKLPRQQWRSSYNAVALKTLERVDNKAKVTLNETTARKEKLGRYLDAIDREVVNNFKVFESQEYPGVRFSHTSISLRKVTGFPENSLVSPKQEEAPGRKLTCVIFTPFSPPPGGDADDVMNAVYDRVFTVLSEIKRHPTQDVAVHVLGLPTSKWGSVSEEWVGDLKKGVVETEEGDHGFAQHGKLYAEFLRTVLPQNQTDLQNVRIRFYGSSMGSILASETAKQFPEIWNKRVLVDVPTGTHKPTGKTAKLPVVGTVPLSAKGLQIMVGFGTELAIRTKLDSLVKTSFGGKKKAREELTTVLLERGIVPHESKAEDALKKDAFLQEIKLLIRGTPFDTDDFRSYVVQGMLDPATVDLKRILFLIKKRSMDKRFFKFGKRTLATGINYTHWMDRGRWPDKWVRSIENYEK